MTKKIIFIIFFIPLATFSQNINSLYNILYVSKQNKERKLQQADSLILNLRTKKSDSLHHFYHAYAYWLSVNDKINYAIDAEREAILFASKKTEQDSSFISGSSGNLGNYLFFEKQFLKGIKAFNTAISYSSNDISSARYYLSIGDGYLKVYDFYNARINYQLGVNILLKSPDQSNLLRNAYQNLSITFLVNPSIENLKQGVLYAQKADGIPGDIYKTYITKLNLARLYNQDEILDFEKSLAYFKTAESLAWQMKDTLKIIEVESGLGDLYNLFDQDKSLFYLKNALTRTSENDSITRGEIYSSSGLTYIIKGNYEKGIENKHKGLAYITGNDFTNPEEIDKNFLIRQPNSAYLFDLLPQLAESYLKYYEVSKNLKHLEKSIAYFKLTDDVIDLIKLNSSEFKSRLFWRKLSANVYGKAIRACYLLGDVESTFYFMEKNKALLLLEDIAEESFKHSLELPKLFLEQEKNLKTKIVQLEWELQKNNGAADKLRKELLDTRRTLDNLNDSLGISKNAINISPDIVPLKKVQQNLKEDEALVEYHVSIDDGYGIYSNKENGYVIFITKNKVELFEISQLSNLKNEVGRLVSYLKQPFGEEKDVLNYTKSSNLVFRKLFQQKQVEKLIASKKLIIVPDSYLSLVPFEALSTNDKNLSFLIKEHEIRYLYSYSFLENTHRKLNNKKMFMGMAPKIFDDNLSLAPLDHTESEFEHLKVKYKGDLFLEEEANKRTFLKDLEKYNIIHLATHADAQDSISPWIAFHNEKLRIEELYLTRNNASLVVLSGCNTTLGKQEIGEGIISLARGFFYSGSQSVISTLWSIDDKASSRIINDFYVSLSNKNSKSTALHEAKLNYLETASLSEQSPYFWASFILMGDNTGIAPPAFSTQMILFIFITILLLTFLGIMLFKKLKK